MSSVPALMLSSVAGLVLGAFYFGGLWLTLVQISRSRRPVLLLMSSFLVRTALVLAGFYVVMDGRWDRIVACLIGFLVSRQWLIGRLQRASLPRTAEDKERLRSAHHA